MCNIPAAKDFEEEENRSSSYELKKVLAATNMKTGCLSPKMVLFGTEQTAFSSLGWKNITNFHADC